MVMKTINNPVYNKHIKQLEEIRQKRIQTLASLIHEGWRKGRYNSETNSYTPRIKEVKDQKWITGNGGVSEIDIANTAFEKLPRDWQEENFLSAKAAIEKIDDILYLIHDHWLDRNDQYASLEQKTQYSRLPIGEKLKDISVLEEAIKMMKEEKN